MEHPNGIQDEAELAFFSAEFWKTYPDSIINQETWDKLLAFQRGWMACKILHNILT